MRYEILGPARVTDEQGGFCVNPHKVAALLVTLLIRADRVVGADQLVTEIWATRAPRRAVDGLHVYVSQLRKLLSRDGLRPDPIVTHPHGYLLRLGSDGLDVNSFLQRAELGRTHARAGQYHEAIEQLDSALSLWRGPVLDDVRHGPIVEGFVAWLADSRLDCLELTLDAQLNLGRHREIIGDLRALTVAHPLREAFYRQLMLALHRSQRRADALMVYQSACARIRGELGLAPCQALQDLHQAILDGGDLVSTGRGAT
jgi:SARP family transcriptional regulator, regulator of embCAB operon